MVERKHWPERFGFELFGDPFKKKRKHLANRGRCHPGPRPAACPPPSCPHRRACSVLNARARAARLAREAEERAAAAAGGAPPPKKLSRKAERRRQKRLAELEAERVAEAQVRARPPRDARRATRLSGPAVPRG